MSTADNCPSCNGAITITTTSEWWEGYCQSCGIPVYLDDNFEWVRNRDTWWPWVALLIMVALFAVAALVEIPH